jgi:hypothetical protein
VIDSRTRRPFDPAMADSPRLTTAKRNEQAARAERLARALRENLHRRKAQARAKERHDQAGPAPPSDNEPAA